MIAPAVFFGAVESLGSELFPAGVGGVVGDATVVDVLAGGRAGGGVGLLGGAGARTLPGLVSRQAITSVARGGTLLNSTTIGVGEALETSSTLRLGVRGLGRVGGSSRAVAGNVSQLVERNILPTNTTLIQEGIVTDTVANNGAVYRAFRTPNQTIGNLTRELGIETPKASSSSSTSSINSIKSVKPNNQIEGITRNYKPTKNPFQTPSSVKEEPVVAKAEPKPQAELNSKTPNSEPKPKTDTERLNIKSEREPNQLDKIKNKLDELRKKLFNEKPTSPERPSNPDFADVPCLASRPVPWDVAIGLIEVAEARTTCRANWENRIKYNPELKQVFENTLKKISNPQEFTIQPDLITGGRGGNYIREEFIGEANSVYLTSNKNRIIFTGEDGLPIADVDLDGVKLLHKLRNVSKGDVKRVETKVSDLTSDNPELQLKPSKAQLELIELMKNKN